MRARELLQEDYNQNLEADLTNLLIGAKGSGAQQIQTKQLVNQLYSMGYSVDVNSVLPLLSNNPVVMNATPEIIQLTSDDGANAGEAPGAGNDSASKVSDMAQKANSI